MTSRERRNRRLAAQLARPSGAAGLLVARRLNRNNAEMLAAAVAACRLRPGGRAADIGFGGGLGLSLLLAAVGPDGQVVGADVSTLMVRRARVSFRRAISRRRLSVVLAPAERLPLADGQLDAAITVNTVYFLPDLDRPFAELARVLRPGGRAVIALNDPEELAGHPAAAYGFVLRPVAAVVESLVRAGLSLVETIDGGGPGRDRFQVLVARRG